MSREAHGAPAFCERCAKRAGCTLYADERQPRCYRNHEGYADPTAYYALLSIEREWKRGQRPPQKRRPRTQVEHYD